jgi:hypothetical protein
MNKNIFFQLTLVPLSHHEVSLSKGKANIPLWFDRLIMSGY